MKLIIDTTENTIEIESKNTKTIYDIRGKCDISVERKMVSMKLNDDLIESAVPIGSLSLTINYIHAVERELLPKI